MIVPLADAGPDCGRKASALGVLSRAGLPVPDGFVVTDPAVDASALAAHLRRLGAGPVAVRSSGLAEDADTASFAGQLETVLGARGLDSVRAAIRHCAASSGTARARGYRAHLDAAGEDRVPVIVQALVEADRAGVLFTRDPRDGADAVLINASWGLGESVVSGAVVPDTIVVTDTVQVTVGTKETRLDLADGGLVRSPVAAADRARACLSPDEVARLVALARRCEALFGRPLDVEWAARDGRFWLVQARPITTRHAPSALAGQPGPALATGVPSSPDPALVTGVPSSPDPALATGVPSSPDPALATGVPSSPGPALVIGVPSSPGRAVGSARLVHTVDDFSRVRRGDVLVCRTTDPAWTPLFRLAAGVVTETGGILCHAAIVAREYGIPAVVGATAAMTRITDGVHVTIDGTTGTITERRP